jgi:hypothetical protein
MGSYVGIDLHRRRSVVVVLNEDGDRVSWSRIDNTPENLAVEIVAAGGPDAEVAMEATCGRNIGRVAAARHLLTLVYYGMRDGEIRCLATDDAA